MTVIDFKWFKGEIYYKTLFILYLSVSLCSPPKATTVLMEDRTSSATAPADAYEFCSLTVNVAII